MNVSTNGHKIGPVPVEAQVRPEVPVTIGDLQFTLVFGMDAIEYLFEDSGVSLLEGINPELLRSPRMLLKLLYAGTREYNPEITEQQLRKVVGVTNFVSVMNAMLQAIGLVVPDEATMSRINQMLPGGKEQEEADQSADPLSAQPAESAGSGPAPDTTSDSA